MIASLHLPVQVEERPLRRDAERNRRRILEAARELFAECGLGVTLNDVAHHAGVGVGTVYRRFPDKAQLIDALFKERIEEFAALMNTALDDPDPWPAFVRFLEQSLELQAKDRGWIFHPPFHNVLWLGRLALSASHLILLGRDLLFAVATAGR